MCFEVYPTTAELIVSVVDSVLLFHENGADKTEIMTILDIPNDAAENALQMSIQLNLLRIDKKTNNYIYSSQFTKYLISANQKQKSIIFRFFY